MQRTFSTRGRDEHAATFRRYAEWNGRPLEELMIGEARKLGNELYNQTAAIAPTAAEIAEDVKEQGWEIPVKFPDGREGRGVPAEWADAAAIRKQKRRKEKRGRPPKGQSRKQLGASYLDKIKTDAAAALRMMQAFVIKKRRAARLYIASGWLGTILDLGGSTKASSGAVDHERGGANITRSGAEVRIRMWNRTPGAKEAEAKYHFMENALLVRRADLLTYITRKMKEFRKG